jgi:hypothetical protein
LELAPAQSGVGFGRIGGGGSEAIRTQAVEYHGGGARRQRCLTARGVLDRADEVLRAGVLDQIPTGAGLNGIDDGLFADVRREDQYRNVGSHARQPARSLHRRHPGQGQVHENHVGLQPHDVIDGLLCVAHGPHRVEAVLLE